MEEAFPIFSPLPISSPLSSLPHTTTNIYLISPSQHSLGPSKPWYLDVGVGEMDEPTQVEIALSLPTL